MARLCRVIVAQFTIYTTIYPVGFYKYNNLPGGIYDIYHSIRMKQNNHEEQGHDETTSNINHGREKNGGRNETNHSRVDS
jgi:hypothetical protein